MAADAISGNVRARPKTSQGLDRRIAQAPLRRVDDSLEREIVIGLRHAAQVGQRVADLQPFVEARAADHPVRQAERNEPFLELAHLERGAHQDGDLVERVVLPLQLLDLLADRARFLLAVPDPRHARLFAELVFGEQGLAEPVLVMRDQTRGGTQDMPCRAIVVLEPDNRRPRKVMLEAQDVVDLGTPPAIDRLIVVTNAA